MSDLHAQIRNSMKEAMRAKEKVRLSAIRMLLAAIKQIEVDQRVQVTDTDVLAILDKMLKQRRDSISQYTAAGRSELADIEQAEIDALQEFMPQPLTESEIATLIEQAISETGAESMRDMGKIMNLLKPLVQGRAEMSEISRLLKTKLN